MIKDRIIEIGGTRRVLLPERCSGPSESYSVKELLAILASDRHSVLITGETGTGKEMLADVVMQMTKRPKGRCQRLNCAGLDSNLVGSELFGHKKGAFTGAESNREGLLKACDGGVLFLDEIGWLQPDLQARLLRFMETGEIRPIGADKIEHHANVRVVAATNKDVNDDKVMIHDLRARFDFEINLPPLRERAGDILWFLCEPAFLGGGEVFTGITLRTLLGILTNRWEGNIRELKKYCQRKIILNPISQYSDSRRYILEDSDICRRNVIDTIVDFSGLALKAYENYRSAGIGATENRGAEQMASLLAGFLCGVNGELWRKDDTSVTVIALAELRRAANNELPGCGLFDFGSFFDYEDDEHLNRPMSDPIALLIPRGVDLDFVQAFECLLRVPFELAQAYPGATTQTGTIKGKLAKVSIRPGQKLLDEVGMLGPGGALFITPQPPPCSAEEGIESLLDKEGIVDPDRSIAILCNRGLSQKDISQHVGLSPTTVREHLVKLRREEKLKDYLPKQKAGRKPKRPPN